MRSLSASVPWCPQVYESLGLARGVVLVRSQAGMGRLEIVRRATGHADCRNFLGVRVSALLWPQVPADPCQSCRRKEAMGEYSLKGVSVMAAIEVIVFVGFAGSAVILAATILVIIGVSQEERRRTMARHRPPTIPALLARRVLGTYLCLMRDERDEH
jgi:hypothetical protein